MHILVPIDGTDLSLDAVRFAIRLSHDGLQAHLLLANVQSPATLYELVKAPNPEVIEQISTAAGSARSRTFTIRLLPHTNVVCISSTVSSPHIVMFQ